jgi:hypothetical protein
MSRRIHGRVIAAVALAAALALASPVHAVGPGGWAVRSGWLLDAWHWLAGAWPGTGASSHDGASAKPARSLLKAGAGVDPDGLAGTGTRSAASTTPASDGGTGLGPNG